MPSNKSTDPLESQQHTRRRIAYLPIDALVDPNPDRAFEREESLLANLARHGLIQPLIVVPWDEQYQVVSGQKQLACCMLLYSEGRLPEGDSLPCIIESQDAIDELLLAEYLQRREMDVLCEAELMDAIRRRLDTNPEESEKILAERLILTEGYIRSTLKLLTLPEQIKSEWKQEGKLYLKRSQLLEIARKKTEEQLPAWTSALKKAMLGKKRPQLAEPGVKQSATQSTMKPKNAITFKSRLENITFANAHQTRKAAEGSLPPQPSPPAELAAELPPHSQVARPGVSVTVRDFHELQPDKTAKQIKTPLVQLPPANDRADKTHGNKSQEDEALLQIDLEDQLPDFGFAITTMLHDLSKFNPARYKPRNKEELIEALEVFINELTETAQVAREIKSKMTMGAEAAAKHLARLKANAGMRPARGIETTVDLSRNSFNEVIEQIIQNLPAEELQRLEKGFHQGMKLNPTLKKRNSERYSQILHGLLIDHFMDQAATQNPDNKSGNN